MTETETKLKNCILRWFTLALCANLMNGVNSLCAFFCPEVYLRLVVIFSFMLMTFLIWIALGHDKTLAECLDNSKNDTTPKTPNGDSE